MKCYASVSVKCGKQSWCDVEDNVRDALQKRFPSFRSDGGGMMIGSNVRDIFFRIDHRSLNKVEPYLKKLGYKIA